jgi:hypothetical protein
MPTASVVHAYRALLWSNLPPDSYTAEAAGALLASLAYVHNWHGFGMGKVGSDDGSDLDPEQRLLRFLQARGRGMCALGVAWVSTTPDCRAVVSTTSDATPHHLHANPRIHPSRAMHDLPFP